MVWSRQSIPKVLDRLIRKGNHWLVVGTGVVRGPISVDAAAAHFCKRAAEVGARVTFLAPHHPRDGLEGVDLRSEAHRKSLQEFQAQLASRGMTEDDFLYLQAEQNGVGNIWHYRDWIARLDESEKKKGKTGFAIPAIRAESILQTRMPNDSVHGIFDQGAAHWIFNGLVWGKKTLRNPRSHEVDQRKNLLADQYVRLVLPGGPILMLFELGDDRLRDEMAEQFLKRGMAVKKVRVNPESKFTIAGEVKKKRLPV